MQTVDSTASTRGDEKQEMIQVGGTGSDLHPRANYLVADTLCNSFALGSVGEIDDFFLVGSPPLDGTDYPLLTGTILDPEGDVLFRLARNELTHNPRNCTKTPGSRMGYKVVDRRGNTVLRVRTTYEMVAVQRLKSSIGMCVTRLEGKFFNKEGQLAFDAQAGKSGLAAGTKSAFNWRGGDAFGVIHGLGDEERSVAAAVIATNGAIHEVVRGTLENETVHLDGKLLLAADLRNCRIVVKTGDFMMSPDSSIMQCAFDFQGAAQRVAVLVASTMAGAAAK